MIVEIHEMINTIEDFIQNPWIKELDIGGCIGTGIFKLCMETVTGFINFTDIMVIEGCQDFIEMQPEFLKNHIFYADAVATCWSTALKEGEEKYPKFLRSEPGIETYVKDLNEYQLIILNDAHLIPSKYKQLICNNFHGKIINVVDPFDYKAECYTHAPTVVDSLHKLSTIQAYARKLIGVETRAIDKTVICKVKILDRLPIRSVGKNDHNQYVTPYEPLIDMIRVRRNDGLRKGQTVICRNDFINTYNTDVGLHTFTNHSIGVLQSNRQVMNGLYKVRMHNSKHCINCDLTMNPDNVKHYETLVEPASIISIDDMRYHKFNSIILVLPDDTCINYNGIKTRELYSVLRSTNDLSIGYVKI